MKLTPAAVTKAKAALLETSAVGIRVGVRGGGCSGLSYVLELETNIRPNDLVVVFDGLQVIMDPKSEVYLREVTLDFETTNLGNYGFRFVNPSEKSRCGCGTSFSV